MYSQNSHSPKYNVIHKQKRQYLNYQYVIGSSLNMENLMKVPLCLNIIITPKLAVFNCNLKISLHFIHLCNNPVHNIYLTNEATATKVK